MKNNVTKKILQYQWEPWLKRPFYAFMMSLFKGSSSKKAFKEIGLSGWEMTAFVFTESTWYWSDKVFNNSIPGLRKWLTGHNISEISENLEIFYVKNKEQIINLSRDKKIKLSDKLLILNDIFQKTASYIWTAHLLEHVIWRDLKEQTKKYIKTDLDKYIGDASYPEKKNALELMEEEMRAGIDLKELRKKYSWMRARDGFARPYKLQELAEHRANLKKYKAHVYPIIPKPLMNLYQKARELVYLRTRRTDVFYEFIFLARPILKELAKKYKIKFSDLKYYVWQDLMAGKLKKYSNDFSYLAYKEEAEIIDGKIFSKQNISNIITEVKGSIAQPGIVRGVAKVVMKVSELNKVKKGDILVTYMTSPNFLQAMKISAAFVTNEGGLTCHAAIIAREIKKPCVIGTRIATDIFKDGDLIEVDANRGIVKLLKRK